MNPWAGFAFLDGSGFLITPSPNPLEEISRAECRNMPKTCLVRGKLTKMVGLFPGLWRPIFHERVCRGHHGDSRTVEKSESGPLGQKLQPRASPGGPDGPASGPQNEGRALVTRSLKCGTQGFQWQSFSEFRGLQLSNRNPWVPHSRSTCSYTK